MEDKNARYPIVIDPIVATLEQILDPGSRRQADAEFGFAVAIDFDRAVVGLAGDLGSSPTSGAVYTFYPNRFELVHFGYLRAQPK